MRRIHIVILTGATVLASGTALLLIPSAYASDSAAPPAVMIPPVMVSDPAASAAASEAATAPTSDAFPTYLAQWLARPNLQFDRLTVSNERARNFYSARQFQPVWVGEHGFNERANAVLAVLSQAGAHGLNPDLYGVGLMRSILAMKQENDEQTLQARLSLEVLMSRAVMRYATDMQGGAASRQWNTGKKPISAPEQIALLQQVADAPDSAAYLTQLAPKNAAYSALQGALANYQAIAEKGGWPAFTVGKTIKPGMQDARVPALRDMLSATGDLAAIATPVVDPTLYDPALVEAVKHFQSRHSIEADGAMGAATQAALAVPVSERIQQIAMTLERMRWMPSDLGARYVLVNVPAYQLTAVAGDKTLAMNVIVGNPKTKTPMFSHAITDVIINPSWGVPQKIATNELLPKIRKNPDYLIRAGYTVVARDSGAAVDPSQVDWDSAGDSYAFRQNPGEGNALGKVKFNIPDSDDIYLHDTAQRGLFSKAERALSHGCIRLSDPKAMTQFVLTDAGWEANKINAAYASATPRTVHVAPMPVHLVYWTSWVDTAGRTHFGRDIYGMDKTLLASMQAPTARETIKLAMNQ